MIWPFRKKAVAPMTLDCRLDNEGWKVGDLARCINDDWTPPGAADPKVGDTRRVSRVFAGRALACESMVVIGLCFDGFGKQAWICTSFVKVRLEIVAADESFTAELRQRLNHKAEA